MGRGLVSFPFFDHFTQRFAVRENQQGMKMVGHEQEQTAVPPQLHMVESGGF
jgi:hypothetical protein